MKMKSITIRQMPESTKENLRIHAAQAGLSLEAYSRKILQAASENDPKISPNLADLSRVCFGGAKGIDLELPPRGRDRKPLDFR